MMPEYTTFLDPEELARRRHSVHPRGALFGPASLHDLCTAFSRCRSEAPWHSSCSSPGAMRRTTPHRTMTDETNLAACPSASLPSSPARGGALQVSQGSESP